MTTANNDNNNFFNVEPIDLSTEKEAYLRSIEYEMDSISDIEDLRCYAMNVIRSSFQLREIHEAITNKKLMFQRF